MSDRLIWHLCWQAAYGHNFTSQPDLASWIRTRLLDAHRRPERTLIDFLLLPCEIHTISQLSPTEGPEGLSREVGPAVSRRMRRDSSIDGPALRGRYLSHWIESGEDLRVDIRMLAWRPVLSGVCRMPSHHVHGTYRIALGMSSPIGFKIRPLLNLFGMPVAEARRTLQRWIGRRPTRYQMEHWELAHGLSPADACMVPVTNDPRGVRGDAAARLIAAGNRGVAGALDVLENWARHRLQEQVGGSHDDLSAARFAVRLRALVGCLAVDHRLCAAAVVARRFGRAKSTLSEQMAACRRRPREALLLEIPVQQIVAEVFGRRGTQNPC